MSNCFHRNTRNSSPSTKCGRNIATWQNFRPVKWLRADRKKHLRWNNRITQLASAVDRNAHTFFSLGFDHSLWLSVNYHNLLYVSSAACFVIISRFLFVCVYDERSVCIQESFANLHIWYFCRRLCWQINNGRKKHFVFAFGSTAHNCRPFTCDRVWLPLSPAQGKTPSILRTI